MTVVDLPPPGFRRVWVADDDWTTDPDVTTRDGQPRRCRSMAGGVTCGRPAVAALNRGVRRRSDGRKRDAWWSYCGDHLYGRRVRNGVVEVRVLRKDDSAS